MSAWDTFAVVSTSTVGLVGSGTAVYVTWRNRKIPTEQHELAENAADDAHWQAMLTTQIETVVKPLNESMAKMGADHAALKLEVADLRQRLESERTRFWGLINHVRQVKLWIIRHVPAEVYHQYPLPIPSEELSADIAVDIT